MIEDSYQVEIGEITELVSEQNETYQDVHVNPQLDENQKKQVVELLMAPISNDVFSDVPKVTNLGEHSTELTSSEPIRSKAYPLPFAMREAVDRELDSMIASGVIEPSTLLLYYYIHSIIIIIITINVLIKVYYYYYQCTD